MVSASCIRSHIATTGQTNSISQNLKKLTTKTNYAVPLVKRLKMSLVVRKPVFGVSDQVRHEPSCTATEDGWGLEISDLGRRGIVLSM